MILDFRAGDTIRVHQKITEGDPDSSGQAKTRIQIFEGVVIGINKTAKSFTVRKVTDGIGVERIWQLASPWIEKIEVKKHAKKIRRAKIYYVRNLTQKEVARVVA